MFDFTKFTRLLLQHGKATETADFLQCKNSAGAVLASIDYLGRVSSPSLQYAIVSISAADIVATGAGKLGHAAGYPLVADPGAGYVVDLVSAVLSYTYSTAQYGAGGNITINSNGGSALTGLVSAANSLGAAADKIVQFVPLSTAAIALTANKGLNLVAASAFTQPGTAAGTVKVFVSYKVHLL